MNADRRCITRELERESLLLTALTRLYITTPSLLQPVAKDDKSVR